tara:strand:+ start:95 stop:496 length:402 start_codon:yes stop_codon:yes gene_type:complete
MKPKPYKTLRSNDIHWFGDNNSHSGKTHILDEVSFEDDYHPFYVKAICGTSFKTRYKDSAHNLDTERGVGCFKCMIKAGYVKYDSPVKIEHAKDKVQVGKIYEVLIPFLCSRFHTETKKYNVGDSYFYHFKSE